MHRAQPGRLSLAWLPVVLALLAGLWLVPASLTFADPPKPKVPDSRARIKPKDAEFTTSVEPAEAKAGETVKYKITAKLHPGSHIYKFAKEKREGPGPAVTMFDFFDPAGLQVEGEWTASKEAIKHKEPAFDLPFVEYYEDEVTWSIPVKIPAGTTPGKKTLRCQAGYMVCDAKRCSFPGQWTLPDAELTVLAAGAAAKPAEPTPKQALAAPAPSAPADQLKSASTSDSQKAASSTTTSVTAPGTPNPETTKTPAAQRPQSPPKPQSEIALTAQKGLVPFLLASALGGLFALLMPCVWPMIPITVNFFVKQGQGKSGRAKATGLAITYCLSIIGVFTAVGVLFSFFFSASALQTLANNPWLNFGVAALFVIFGLSLLGLFEIRLPSFLLNASAQGEGRGGVIGVVFMALTLTITSFTCTFPVVGGLLVMAANGNFFYPIIGLAMFATVVALPFFLLALSPGLISRMPRSGDWMNAIKVVGGLVEIGAALKFINTAEQAFYPSEDAWFNAPVVLTSWIALSLVCGLYLLGVFRTDHDHDEVKVGPGRLLFGAVFLGLALFLIPALFGHVPQSQIWSRLIVGLLPPDSSAFSTPVAIVGEGGESSGAVKATSTDPAQAEREQKSFHGVLWGMSFDQAREQAAAENKPILIDFTGVNCSNCRQMEQGVFPRPDVAKLLRRFVTVQLYTDFVPIGSIPTEQMQKRAELNQDRLLDLTQEATNPFYVVLSPTGEVLDKIGGYNEPRAFTEFLNKALEKFPVAGNGAETSKSKVKATSTSPEQAVRDQSLTHGVAWGLSYDQARERAAAQKKPILIDFTGVNDANSRQMEIGVFPRPDIVPLLGKFVTVQLYTDYVPSRSLTPQQSRQLAERNQDLELDLIQEATTPIYAVLSPNGDLIDRLAGVNEPDVFKAFLTKALEKLPQPARVAQADSSAK